MFEDFKKFIFQGNVLDLAIAVVIGAAFKAVIDSLVNDVIMAVIGAIFGKANFNDLTFALGDGVVSYGKFITALVNFLLIAAALFVVVKTYERLQERRGKMRVEAATPSDEVVLLTEIRDSLRSPTS